VSSPVEDAGGIERSIQSLAREPNGGLVIPPDATTVVHRDFVSALAARHRLPTVYTANFWVIDRRMSV
jgi:putative ABC transport system substrate-binding protein